MKTTYYDTCPKCGCTLDPDEICEDCFPKEKVVLKNTLDYKTVMERIARKEAKSHAKAN